MKFFQKLLVAPATLGLLTPISANANEVNLKDIASYSDVESIDFANSFNKTDSKIENNLLAGGEGLVDDQGYGNDHNHSGGFSDTTTMSGSASFQVGAVEEGVTTQSVTANYSYEIDLNSSFTGDDNLYVGIETGNSAGQFVTENSIAESDYLKVGSMYYQFPVGNFDVAVGPKLDNDDLMPTTISTYSDEFFMGGNALTETNFWLYGYTGAGFAVSRTLDSGFNFSGGVIGTNASSDGYLTDEGYDVITVSAGYDARNFGGGIVYVDGDNYCSQINEYLSTACSTLGVSTISVDVLGIGAYWTPNEGKTMISATTNRIDATITGVDIEAIADFQIGIDHQIGDGILSAAWKSLPLLNVISSTDYDSDTLGTYYEFYYTHPVNDSLDLMYGITFAEPDTDDGDSFELYDYTAVGAQATFKF